MCFADNDIKVAYMGGKIKYMKATTIQMYPSQMIWLDGLAKSKKTTRSNIIRRLIESLMAYSETPMGSSLLDKFLEAVK